MAAHRPAGSDGDARLPRTRPRGGAVGLSAPRLEIHLGRLDHNARTLVERLARRGIAVTGVSKATLGLPEIVRTWQAAGIASIGESRIETIEALQRSGVTLPMLLLRSPMASQLARVVAHAAVSCNSELAVIEGLAVAAADQGRRHGVLLMVELGDLREGLLPADLEAVARRTLQIPALRLVGIGTNLACQHGVCPDARNMAELSALASGLENRCGVTLELVSGGNSANLPWLAAGGPTGRINHLRLGEALLLGREPLGGTPIPGLHTDAITLVAEVIEAKCKPTRPWGRQGRTSFGVPAGGLEAGALALASACGQERRQPTLERRALLALGEQDAAPAGLGPPDGVRIVGASSDHLVVERSHRPLAVGEELRFRLDYAALLRAMTSPFVSRVFL